MPDSDKHASLLQLGTEKIKNFVARAPGSQFEWSWALGRGGGEVGSATDEMEKNCQKNFRVCASKHSYLEFDRTAALYLPPSSQSFHIFKFK